MLCAVNAKVWQISMITSQTGASKLRQEFYFFFTEDEAYLINYIKEVEGSTDIETEYIQTGSLCQISTNLLNSNNNGDDITTAFVFENIQIPNNASIEQAFLELQSGNASEYAEANTQIAISKFDKSDSIKGCLFKDSSHYASTALIDWNMPQWYISETYESPDISSLIRYVINTNDWKEGNDIILVVKNKLAPTSSQQRKIHYNQTKLKISYRNMKSK